MESVSSFFLLGGARIREWCEDYVVCTSVLKNFVVMV